MESSILITSLPLKKKEKYEINIVKIPKFGYHNQKTKLPVRHLLNPFDELKLEDVEHLENQSSTSKKELDNRN